MLKKYKEFIFHTLFYKEIINLEKNTSLNNKVVIITGASKGIGYAIATTLLEQQANIVAVSRNKKDLREAFAGKEYSSLLFVEGDVTNENDCKKIIQETIKKFGKIDALINNVGMFAGKELETITLDEWQKTIEVNIQGMFLMSKHVISIMKKQKSGLIVNIGSKISHNTNVSSNMTLYATAKYAVEGFSLALEKEVKPFGIRVSCIMPGTVNTVLSLQAKDHLSPFRIGQIIALLIQLDTVTFESIIVKSQSQNI